MDLSSDYVLLVQRLIIIIGVRWKRKLQSARGEWLRKALFLKSGCVSSLIAVDRDDLILINVMML